MEKACLIPARGRSKRVKNKNIKLLGGRPLISYTIQTAFECGFSPIILSTDSEEISEVALHEEPKLIIDHRPPGLARDESTDNELIYYVVERYLEPGSILAYLRPTTPFRNREIIFQAINYFLQNGSGFQSLICVEELTESAYKSFLREDDGIISPVFPIDPNMPNQFYPKTYRNNGYLDLFRLPSCPAWRSLLLAIFGFVTDKTIEIDTEFDFFIAETYLNEMERR